VISARLLQESHDLRRAPIPLAKLLQEVRDHGHRRIQRPGFHDRIAPARGVDKDLITLDGDLAGPVHLNSFAHSVSPNIGESGDYRISILAAFGGFTTLVSEKFRRARAPVDNSQTARLTFASSKKILRRARFSDASVNSPRISRPHHHEPSDLLVLDIKSSRQNPSVEQRLGQADVEFKVRRASEQHSIAASCGRILHKADVYSGGGYQHRSSSPAGRVIPAKRAGSTEPKRQVFATGHNARSTHSLPAYAVLQNGGCLNVFIDSIGRYSHTTVRASPPAVPVSAVCP